ncbi:MAG: hypothetical protein ACRC4M_04610 [Mycoplasma sp.]
MKLWKKISWEICSLLGLWVSSLIVEIIKTSIMKNWLTILSIVVYSVLILFSFCFSFGLIKETKRKEEIKPEDFGGLENQNEKIKGKSLWLYFFLQIIFGGGLFFFGNIVTILIFTILILFLTLYNSNRQLNVSMILFGYSCFLVNDNGEKITIYESYKTDDKKDIMIRKIDEDLFLIIT